MNKRVVDVVISILVAQCISSFLGVVGIILVTKVMVVVAGGCGGGGGGGGSGSATAAIGNIFKRTKFIDGKTISISFSVTSEGKVDRGGYSKNDDDDDYDDDDGMMCYDYDDDDDDDDYYYYDDHDATMHTKLLTACICILHLHTYRRLKDFFCLIVAQY